MTRSHLRPCLACSRHVFVTEASCPFCGGALDPSFARAVPPQPPSRRLSRAAIVALGAGTFALAPGCGRAFVSVYGGPPIEAFDAHALEPDAGSPPAAPVYGAPPVESGGKSDAAAAGQAPRN